MVTADFYDHSDTTAINETCQPDPLSAVGERGGRFAATAALPLWQLCCHMGLLSTEVCSLDSSNF